jgi:uncharacterized protein YkwD
MLVAAVILAVAVGVSIIANGVFGHGGSTSKDSAHLGSANVMTAIQSPLATVSGSIAPGSPGTSATPSPSRKPSPKPSPKPTKQPAPPAGTSEIDQLLAQINDLRAQNGLPPYTLLSGLNRSAHAHNVVMMGSCGLSHQCPGEASLGARITAQGVHWTACGENIGWSGPHPNTTSAIVAAAEALTQSMYNEKPPDDGHRLNLLSSAFHHVGIDVQRDSSGKVWLTQDFSN